jgi:hypothetical protein
VSLAVARVSAEAAPTPLRPDSAAG